MQLCVGGWWYTHILCVYVCVRACMYLCMYTETRGQHPAASCNKASLELQSSACLSLRVLESPLSFEAGHLLCTHCHAWLSCHGCWGPDLGVHFCKART